MKDSFVIIKEALTNAGLDTHMVQYSFTPYSLNTDHNKFYLNHYFQIPKLLTFASNITNI